MKIAISADGPNWNAKVAHRFGTSEYLLIIDVDSGALEAVSNPVGAPQQGAGVQLIVLAVSRGVEAILTGYCSPAICNQIRASGIEVLTGISGTAEEAIKKYKKGYPKEIEVVKTQPGSVRAKVDGSILLHAARSAARQFVTLLPVLVSVVLLIGLFDMFVSKELLSSIFLGNAALDTLWGACFGSIFAGNPINSYVIGGELLKHGVSLFAVTAFILTWVTVGLVQIPAEIAAFGKRFALLRNGLSFGLAIPIAILTVLILNLVGRWIS